MGKGDKKDFSLSLEMTMQKTAFFLLSPQRDAPKAMCEEWQSYSYGTLPPSSGRRCPEGAEVGFRSGMKRNGKRRFPVSSSRAQPRDLFRFAVSVFLCKSVCMESGASRYPLPSQLLPDRERKRFLAFARNDDRGKAEEVKEKSVNRKMSHQKCGAFLRKR